LSRPSGQKSSLPLAWARSVFLGGRRKVMSTYGATDTVRPIGGGTWRRATP
jgi:hypothetical protein